MSNLIILDEQTAVVEVGARQQEMPLSEVKKHLSKPTYAAVVPCEMVQVVAGSEAALDMRAVEALPPNHVYCYQRLHGAVFQVFGMSEALLRSIRALGPIDVVVPYVLAARNSERISHSIRSTVITRVSRAFGVDTEESELPAVQHEAVIADRVGNVVLVTAIRGHEIKATRRLTPGPELARELFVTLQGAGLTEPHVIAHDPNVAAAFEEVGHKVEPARIPPDAAGFGFHGLRKPPPERFFLKDEVLARRRSEARRKQIRSLARIAAFVTLCVMAAAASLVNLGLRRKDLAKQTIFRQQREAELAQLYTERYAGFVGARRFNLPQAWAELALMMPPQLLIDEVKLEAGLQHALMSRRPAHELGFVDPPLSLKELRVAVERSAAWRGANISLVLDSHDFSYSLEKQSGNPSH